MNLKNKEEKAAREKIRPVEKKTVMFKVGVAEARRLDRRQPRFRLSAEHVKPQQISPEGRKAVAAGLRTRLKPAVIKFSDEGIT